MNRKALTFVLLICLKSFALGQQASPPEKERSALKESQDVQLLLRIPSQLIAKSLNRDFEHAGPVNQVLLGTTSTGTSHCVGRVSCVVEDNKAGVSILCCISGTVESKTCGTNGPAIIRSTALTHYQASKRVNFNGRVFGSSPSSVDSSTKITTTGIESSLPRLRGRLVKRVATKRVHDSQAQVEAIVGSQTETELKQKIDADFEARIADMNKQFESKLSILNRFPGAEKHLQLRSTIDGVEVAMGRSPQNQSDSSSIREPIGKSIEVWLRRSDHLVAATPIASMLFTKAPAWISAYFLENPMFLKPDERKWSFEVREKWIVVSLHD